MYFDVISYFFKLGKNWTFINPFATVPPAVKKIITIEDTTYAAAKRRPEKIEKIEKIQACRDLHLDLCAGLSLRFQVDG